MITIISRRKSIQITKIKKIKIPSSFASSPTVAKAHECSTQHQL